MAARYDDISDSDDEEEECRVCRGPAEEGRPLFKPCKCSGSIGLTHQDCLTSWLDVTRGDGRCELCSTRFKFAPQYAESTPDRLSPQEVWFRILRRLGAKWLPRGLRALFAASLWLIILPLSTSYIYHGWMYRPSAVVKRWTWELAKRDTVGGAIIAIVIVVSFLSLMSFAEFLRFQWGGLAGGGAGGGAQQQGQQQRQGDRRNRGNNNREGGARGAIEGEIDDIVIHHDESDEDDEEVDIDRAMAPFINHLLAKDGGSIDNDDIDEESKLLKSLGVDGQSEVANNPLGINEVQIPADGNQNDEQPGLDDSDRELVHPADAANEEDELEAFMRAQEEQDMMEDDDQQQQPQQPQQLQQHQPNQLPELEDLPPPLIPQPRQPAGRNARPPRDDARFEPQFEPLQPAFDPADVDAEDDGVDMEINIALDELLGFRGPLLALIRNLLWLLVFNTAYIGVFAFSPQYFGHTTWGILRKFRGLQRIQNLIPNYSIRWISQIWDGIITSMQELDKKSKEFNLIYEPRQIARLAVGYLSFAVMIFLFKIMVGFAIRLRAKRRKANEQTQADLRRDAFENNRMEEFRRLQREEDERNGDQNKDPLKQFNGFLICAVAISKVVLLLFIKMLFLPLLLGIWLDLATLPLFNKTWSDRIDYSGIDLFGSIFLHWVTGITFMLLVTVSVLQLREVTHPDILARVIRPQEPQPDLLGNLLQESGATHTKRVLLSLAIYAALLAIHIWLPALLLLRYNLGKYLPLFQPKFWHIIMPQIQVPIELFIFHLCMLGVLEKYKNGIGEMQHHWLLLMGKYLKVTDQILPREVEQFSLVGTLPVFSEDSLPSQLENIEEVPFFEGQNDAINPIWNKMLSETDQSKREELIRANVFRMDTPDPSQSTKGITGTNGKIVLASHSYIRLPLASKSSRLVVKTSDDASSNLLPTIIGPYRLKQGVSRNKSGEKITHIEVWREEFGKPIPRPPEGWDDLGVGGAERQGRWAWGEEHISEIENSVAVRTPFFTDPSATKLAKACTFVWLTVKIVFLLLISWAAISVLLCAVLNIPLYAGRFALYTLRIPGDYIHDPLAFALGIGPMIAAVAITAKLFAVSKKGFKGIFSFVRDSTRSSKARQPREKVKTLSIFIVLWLAVCPMLIGSIYGTFWVGASNKFTLKSDLLDVAFINWGTGTLLLNMWAIMCYFKMFTKRFWRNIIVGEARVDDDDEDQEVGARQGGGNNAARNDADGDGNDAQGTDAANAANDESQGFTWQGEDGVIARAFHSVRPLFTGWEWDKIDRQALLQDCALPISKHLAISFVAPIAVLLTVTPLTNVYLSQIGATAIFRIFAIVTVFTDAFYSSKDGLSRWFEAAHKIARDDRYLIGEILLNHGNP